MAAQYDEAAKDRNMEFESVSLTSPCPACFVIPQLSITFHCVSCWFRRSSDCTASCTAVQIYLYKLRLQALSVGRRQLVWRQAWTPA